MRMDAVLPGAFPPASAYGRMRAAGRRPVTLWTTESSAAGCRHSAEVTRKPTRPAALRGKIFRGSQQVACGRVTRAQLRSRAWQHLFPDVYACASLRITHRRRARAVSVLLLPGAVLSGRSAAVMWGVDDLAGRDDPVECTVVPKRRSGAVRGVAVNRRSLGDDDVVTKDGVPVTTPLRTALDLARIQPPDEAVVCLDQFLRSRLVTLEEVRSAEQATTGPGCRGIRLAAARADGLAESPQETRVRLVLHASRLPRPVAQYVVREDGRFVAKVDFAWPDAKLALEYDGVWHGRPQQVGPDRRRLNRLTAAGWTVLFVTAADLHDPVALVARIGAALAARR
jgi:hypothetical protein